MAALDNTDELGLTKAYCEAVVPSADAKKKIFDKLFSKEVDSLRLHQIRAYVGGYRKFEQIDILDEFAESFFEKILDTVNTTARSVSEPIFYGLRPNMHAN